MNWDISVSTAKSSKNLPPSNTLGFGKYFSDHMFVARYSAAKGWHEAKVTAYEPFAIDPGASVLHYGQALFEGLKAFKQKDGKIGLFRSHFNWKRMVSGSERMCMVPPPEDLWQQGLKKLLEVDSKWVPQERGTALYIRPTLIGTESFLGVRPSNEFLFFIILSPVSSYYSEGAKPVKIWIEKFYTRAAPGGLGATKAAANYAGSLKAAYAAKERGYSQVLWLDVSKSYVEEVGTMNVFFVIGDEVVTPALDGTILEGGTREVVITLLKEAGIKISQRKLSVDELLTAQKSGNLKEAFGAGTAAVISPIGELASDNFKITLGNGEEWGPVATDLYKKITAIHYGEVSDPHGWIEKI